MGLNMEALQGDGRGWTGGRCGGLEGTGCPCKMRPTEGLINFSSFVSLSTTYHSTLSLPLVVHQIQRPGLRLSPAVGPTLQRSSTWCRWPRQSRLRRCLWWRRPRGTVRSLCGTQGQGNRCVSGYVFTGSVGLSQQVLPLMYACCVRIFRCRSLYYNMLPQIASLLSHTYAVCGLSFSPDGTTLTSLGRCAPPLKSMTWPA